MTVFLKAIAGRAKLPVGFAVLALSATLTARADDPRAQARDEIIALIEERLSGAYSFGKKDPHKVPHFEVLDELFPKWHGGSPAVGRNFWLMAEYKTFLVFYRVDYVHLVNSLTAVAEGKKLIVWTRQDEGVQLEKLWPFQLWDRLVPARGNKNSYLSAVYAMHYRMKLSRSESGRWFVVEEESRDAPNMENDLRVHCLFAEQLRRWGLRSTCREMPLSMP